MSDDQVSSESTESTSSSETSSQGVQSEAPQQEAAVKEAERQVPFHEHPRFKEVIEQKNQAAKEAEELRRSYQALTERVNAFESQQKPKSMPQEHPMIARLKGIDPEFADYISGLHKSTQDFQQTQQELANLRQERLREQATSKMTELYTSNKVPENRKAFYDQAVKSKVYEIESGGKRLSVNDLDSIFKSVHDEHSKFFDNYERQLRESYVKDKKKDATTPNTQTGGAAAAIPQGAGPETKDEVKALLAKGLRQFNQKI